MKVSYYKYNDANNGWEHIRDFEVDKEFALKKIEEVTSTVDLFYRFDLYLTENPISIRTINPFLFDDINQFALNNV